MAIALVLWSIILSIAWEVTATIACVFIILGTIVGLRLMALTSPLADSTSFVLYNVSENLDVLVACSS